MSSLGEDTAVVTPLHNPFKAQQRKGHEDTLKYCAWEVLKDFPRGLHISHIEREIRERGLRDLSRMRNARGQISSELVRAKDVFCQAREGKMWWIRSLAPSDLMQQKAASSTTDGTETPKREELVGHRVAVWWKGERRYFDGIIANYNAESNTHSVVYDDGDTDEGLEFRSYGVQFKNGKIDVVTVSEHNLDDMDDECSSAQKESATSREDGSEWTMSGGGDASCSRDSTTGAEFSGSTMKTGRKAMQNKRQKNGRSVINKPKGRARGPLNLTAASIKPIGVGERGLHRTVHTTDEALAAEIQSLQLKRKHEPCTEASNIKKPRVEQVDGRLRPAPRMADILAYRAHRNVGLDKDLKHGIYPMMACNAPEGLYRHPSNRYGAHGSFHPSQAVDWMADPKRAREYGTRQDHPSGLMQSAPNNAPMMRNAFDAGRHPTHRAETINVLDLARRMQPPKDMRPVLKTLRDVGELMSLSELSNELKQGQDGDSDVDEVTSRQIDIRDAQEQRPDMGTVHDTTRTERDAQGSEDQEPGSQGAAAATPKTETHPTAPTIERTMAAVPSGSGLSTQHLGRAPLHLQCDRKSTDLGFSFRAADASAGGRELLSPSILSKTEANTSSTVSTFGGRWLDNIPNTSMGTEARHQAHLVGEPSPQHQLARSTAMVEEPALRVSPSVRSSMAPMEVALKNTECNSSRFDSPQFQPQMPTDATATRTPVKDQWKGRFPVAGV